MKTALVILLTVMMVHLSFTGYSQKERDVWCFGEGVELDFSSGTPVNVFSCAINTEEGCASIADKTTGQLLFYSDGSNVYNSQNDVMPSNYIPLGGNPSTTQSAYIVPMPGSDHEYYIFCTDAQAGAVGYLSTGGDSGTQYTIIDMNLDGGLGDIEQQPVPLLTPTCEKIAGVPMPGNTGYWIIVHLWNSDAFYSYPLTASGIGAPVISNTGLVQEDVSGITYDNQGTIGYMRISPDGTKLAMATDLGLHSIQVFNFDNSTGSITGILFSDTSITGYYLDNNSGPYGICFSPGNRFLYVAAEGDTNVYRYYLLAGNESDIVASRSVVGYNSENPPFAMQTGPDNKIYIACYNGYTLDRIDYPDSVQDCGYESQAVYLSSGTCQLGLPEFPPPLIQGCSLAPPVISSPTSLICANDSAAICAPAGYTSYQWNTGITGTGNCIEATQAGDYYVQVTDNNGCKAQSNQLAISVYPVPSVSIVVQGDTLSSFGQVSYQWLYNGNAINGATGQVFIAHQSGYYSVEVTDTNGCTTISQPVSTGVKNLTEESVSVYPNPSAGNWQLSVGNELLGSALQIFDEQGRLVFQSPIRNLQSEITAGSLASGVYYLRISSSTMSVVRKLVKL